MREAWAGLKQLTGQNKVKSSAISGTEEERAEFVEKLNTFYCRFERPDIHEELSSAIGDLKEKADEEKDSFDFEVDEGFVSSLFRKLNIRKACGPDNLTGRLLKSCHSQLSFVFSQLFSWSLMDGIVPSLWKKSTIVPIPKNRSPSALNDYRPVVSPYEML